MREAVRSQNKDFGSKSVYHFLPSPLSKDPLFLISLPTIQIKALLSCLFSKAHPISRFIVEGHRPPSLCTLFLPCLVADRAPAGVG